MPLKKGVTHNIKKQKLEQLQEENKMNLAVLAGQAGSQNAGGSIMTMVILYAVIIGIFWFFAIRPQSKQKKEHENLLSTLEVGDSILTTSGFLAL